jgi:tetratricopeptide (TPR) repeat protein
MDDEPLEAIAHFQRAHELYPQLPHVLREWARALWRAKRLDEALDKFRSALSFDPGDAWAYCYMGILLLGTGESSEAKSAFERAVSLKPRDGFFWGNLGYAHQELGELSDAERCFRKGLSLELDSSYLHRRYGLFLKRIGKPQKATRYLTRALKLDPTDKKARAALEQLDS